MNARPKKKLCWNCEGNVSLKAENCPYCGVCVSGLATELSSETPVAPYRLVSSSEEDFVPASPYHTGHEFSSQADDKGSEVEEEEEELELPEGDSKETGDDSKLIVFIVSLLAFGTVFFIFGFALFLFSDDGFLTLQWDASYWYAYFLLSLPLLFFGFRQLNRLRDES